MTPMDAAQVEHEATEFRPGGGVVVGDDGSDCAAVAIRTAAEDAARRGVRLHVLRAWSITNAVRPDDLPRGVVASVHELEQATLAFQRRRVAELIGELAVDVEVHVVHAPAAKALVLASETADLVVVGTRGLGGFKHMLVGSVAEQCVRHAHGSVLVVRG